MIKLKLYQPNTRPQAHSPGVVPGVPESAPPLHLEVAHSTANVQG